MAVLIDDLNQFGMTANSTWLDPIVTGVQLWGSVQSYNLGEDSYIVKQGTVVTEAYLEDVDPITGEILESVRINSKYNNPSFHSGVYSGGDPIYSRADVDLNGDGIIDIYHQRTGEYDKFGRSLRQTREGINPLVAGRSSIYYTEITHEYGDNFRKSTYDLSETIFRNGVQTDFYFFSEQISLYGAPVPPEYRLNGAGKVTAPLVFITGVRYDDEIPVGVRITEMDGLSTVVGSVYFQNESRDPNFSVPGVYENGELLVASEAYLQSLL